MKTLIHYGEIALKGRNRKRFEEQLKINIELGCNGKASLYHGRIELEGGNVDNLKSVFGIVWFAECNVLESKYDIIEKTALSMFEKEAKTGKTFALRVKRSDKRFPLTSQQVAIKLGDVIGKRFELSVNLDDPDLELNIEITDTTYLYFNKQIGRGGLPVGISGRVLVLFSGGMDSALASLLMAKRGCIVDMFHVHAFSDNKKVETSKISKIINILSPYTHTSKLFIAPFTHFQLSLPENSMGYEAVLFRRFITRCAYGIAQKYEYKAIILGDSIGQVASQTLENLSLIDAETGISLFRPLVGFDKQEIIDKCRTYGIHDVCSETYKDCCSLISQSPKTRAKRDTVEKIEKGMEIDDVISKTIKELSEVDYSLK